MVGRRGLRALMLCWLCISVSALVPSAAGAMGGDQAIERTISTQREAQQLGTTFASFSSRDDLLNRIGVVDEQRLNGAACGVAAATMVLDYYYAWTRPKSRPPSLHAVATYVKIWSRVRRGKIVLGGTTFGQLELGLERAGQAFDVPLSATWAGASGATDAFLAVESEVGTRRPVIIFIPDGGVLWHQRWHFGHYVVVSGFTKSGSVIYHDPWDGRAHVLSRGAFAKAWGTSWHNNHPWQYMTVTPWE